MKEWKVSYIRSSKTYTPSFPDRRLTQCAVCTARVRDAMIVIMWYPALPDRMKHILFYGAEAIRGSCGVAVTCTALTCSCLRDWLCTHFKVEAHR